MKENKGFTLAELIGVVTLVGILCLITFPPIIKQVQQKEKDVDEATKQIVFAATELYINSHFEEYQKVEGDTYCISLQQLIDEDYLEEPFKDASGKEISLTTMIGVDVLSKENLFFTYAKKECKNGN